MELEKTYLIKEIDRLKSLNHKGRVVSEYIIYTMVGETIIDAATIIDSPNKVNKFLNWSLPENVKITRIPYENK